MSAIREATSISGMPMGEAGEDGIYYAVGHGYTRRSGKSFTVAGIVSRITVTEDLPGLHCNMERVRVFDGETMIFEAPLHSLEGVTYPAPGEAEAGQ